MVTLKLNKTAAKKPTGPDKTPVRSAGVKKKRPTLAEAQAERAEREARYQAERQGDRPPPRDDRGPDRRGPGPGGRPNERPNERSNARPNNRPDNRFNEQRPNDRFNERPAGPRRDPRDAPPPRARDPREAFDNRPRHAPDDRRPPAGSGPNSAFDRRPPAGPRERVPDERPREWRDDARPPMRNERPRSGPFDGPPRHERPNDNRFDNRQGNRPDNRNRPPQRGPGNNAPYGPDRSRPWSPEPPRHAPAQSRPRARPRDDDDEDDAHTDQPGSLRLSKRISELGLASRREADVWIEKGWVRVDGKLVKELGSRVQPDQLVTIDALAYQAQSMLVTVMINKPMGYVSGQAEDGYEPAVVLVTANNQWRQDGSGIRFLPHHLRKLAPAGRLDIDSVGLLVLTQDGRVAKQLIGQDSEIEKEYLVRVETLNGQPLSDEGLAQLNHGLELDGEPLKPALVEWVNDDQLRFVLREGKKRQIRRMCELVCLHVTGLKRVRIGNVMLGDLPPGQWRYLRADEKFG